jgi:hypothetical protein
VSLRVRALRRGIEHQRTLGHYTREHDASVNVDPVEPFGPSPWTELHHARAVYVLRRAGIDPIVLKGITTSRWLYPESDRRAGDLDILVRETDLPSALAALTSAGYADIHAGTIAGEVASHSVTVGGNAGLAQVDAHISFPGIGVTPENAWTVLQAHTMWEPIAHVETLALDFVGRAVIIALHAARNGPQAVKSTEDLRRCIAEVSRLNYWERTVMLVEQLCAGPAFAAGMQLLPEGRSVLTELPVRITRANDEWRLRSSGAGTRALALFQLTHGPVRGRLRLLARELWPTKAFMRIAYPSATRGPMPLLWARVQRTWDITRALPAAVRAVRAARREPGNDEAVKPHPRGARC